MEKSKVWTAISIMSILLTMLLLGAVAKLWTNNSILKSEIENVKTSKAQMESKNSQLETDISSIKDEIKKISDAKTQVKSNPDKTLYYISKLGDKNFTSTYNQEYTWYIAAEELGKIGKEAIPLLIENLQTKSNYEKCLTFYALQLASQNENVKTFTKGNYINVGSALSFDEKDFNNMQKIVDEWWQKYKSNW